MRRGGRQTRLETGLKKGNYDLHVSNFTLQFFNITPEIFNNYITWWENMMIIAGFIKFTVFEFLKIVANSRMS